MSTLIYNNILLNGIESKLSIHDDQLVFEDVENKVTETWKISDVIGIEEPSADAENTKEIRIHVIEDGEERKLIDKTATLGADDEHVLKEIVRKIKQKLNKVSSRPRHLLVLINPVGGSHAGEQVYGELVAPIFRLAEIETEVLVSKRSKYFLDVLKTYDISKFDGIVICGGDGTVNECLASIYKRAQEDAGIDYNDPDAKVVPFPLRICQIPTGTGNGLVEMACGAKDIQTVVLHVIRGQTYNLNLYSVFSGGQLLSYYTVILMFGAWADMFDFVDRHRWLRTMRYLFLPFVHFLLKRQPRYDVELQLQRKDGTTDTVKDTLVNLVTMNFDGYTEDFHYNTERRFDQTVIFTYTPCWGTQLLSQLLTFILTRTKNVFERDYIRGDRVIGLKMKFQPDYGDQRPNLINVDGEILELPKPDFEIKLLGRILPVFSSVDPIPKKIG